MINKKGFTLIEVIAVVAILGILSMAAIPGVYRATDKNKKNTYVNDANRMIAKAKSIYNGDTSIDEPTSTTCVLFSLKDLGINDLATGPNKGKYLENYSYVTVNHYNNKDYYGVQLVEQYKTEQRYRGIKYTYDTEGSHQLQKSDVVDTQNSLYIFTNINTNIDGRCNSPIRP